MSIEYRSTPNHKYHSLEGEIENLKDLKDLRMWLDHIKYETRESYIEYYGRKVYGTYIPSGEIGLSWSFNSDEKDAFEKIFAEEHGGK